MATLSGIATITVLNGPDRGKVFEVRDELVHIGAGEDNEIPLCDEALGDCRVRIVCRNGRYAISTPAADVVEVDGNVLPADRWVWLPESARVRLGGKTVFQFTFQPGEDGQPAENPSAKALADTSPDADSATPAPRRKARQKKPAQPGKPEEGAGRQVARFITSHSGDALVTLGEDGKLPELTLLESAGARKRPREKKKSSGESSWLVYAAVGVSLLMSIALLFVEFEPGPVSSSARAEAYRQISRFWGDPAREPLRPYQELLRTAALERSRGNRAGELEEYTKVRDLLCASDLPDSGLTGNKEDDRELERLIGILMR